MTKQQQVQRLVKFYTTKLNQSPLSQLEEQVMTLHDADHVSLKDISVRIGYSYGHTCQLYRSGKVKSGMARFLNAHKKDSLTL